MYGCEDYYMSIYLSIYPCVYVEYLDFNYTAQPIENFTQSNTYLKSPANKFTGIIGNFRHVFLYLQPFGLA